jgi:hypothetical protein
MKKYLLIVIGLSIGQFARAEMNPKWIPLISCEGGAFRIQVNPDERRQLQLVIQNTKAQTWLGYMYQECSAKGEGYRPCYNTLGNLEIAGGTPYGVFRPSEFHSMRANGGYNQPGKPWARSMDFIARREGEEVRVVQMSDAMQVVN